MGRIYKGTTPSIDSQFDMLNLVSVRSSREPQPGEPQTFPS